MAVVGNGMPALVRAVLSVALKRVERLGKAVVVDVAVGGVGAGIADVGVGVDGEAWPSDWVALSVRNGECW